MAEDGILGLLTTPELFQDSRLDIDEAHIQLTSDIVVVCESPENQEGVLTTVDDPVATEAIQPVPWPDDDSGVICIGLGPFIGRV